MSTHILLIDFSWIFNKIYYAQKYLHPQDVASAHVRGVIGLFDTFNKTIFTRYNKIYIVLDCKTECTRGRSINEDYKKGRPNHDKVYKYLELVAGALANIPKVLVVQNRNREADEIISYLCHKYNNSCVDIYSGDKDLIQLTQSVNVNITDTYKQGAFTFFTEQDIFKKFKNSKKEDFTRISNNIGDIIKYRVLRGDTSDNLPPLFPRIRDTQIKEITTAWKGNILDEEVFKEIYFLRKAIKQEDFNSIGLELNLGIYVNLGNSFSHYGRTINAIKYYDKAIALKFWHKNVVNHLNYFMALINKAKALEDYSNLDYDDGHKEYFIKFAYKLYKEALTLFEKNKNIYYIDLSIVNEILKRVHFYNKFEGIEDIEYFDVKNMEINYNFIIKQFNKDKIFYNTYQMK